MHGYITPPYLTVRAPREAVVEALTAVPSEALCEVPHGGIPFANMPNVYSIGIALS